MKLFTIFLISLFVVSTQAAICEIPKEEVSCSPNYFVARSERDLDRYLNELPKEDEKQLALEIAFKYSTKKDISIKSACSVKLSKNALLLSKKGSVCLASSNISLSGIVKAKDDIQITANNSVSVVSAILQSAKGDILIETKKVDYFQGEISLASKVRLLSRNIRLNSLSKLRIDNLSSVASAKSVELNGGYCHIPREKKRGSKKYKRKIIRRKNKYSGNCLDVASKNYSLKIEDTDSIRKKKISILNLNNDDQVFYRFNREGDILTGIDLVKSFDIAGLYLLEVAIVRNDGRFSLINKEITIDQFRYALGKFVELYFYNMKGDGVLNGSFGNDKIELYEKDSGVYLWPTTSLKNGDGKEFKLYEKNKNKNKNKFRFSKKHIIFKGRFSFYLKEKIVDPKGYLMDNLDNVSILLDNNESNDQSFNQLKNNLYSLIDELRGYFLSKSEDELYEIALGVSANYGESFKFSSNNSRKNNGVKALMSDFFNLISDNVYAQDATVESSNEEFLKKFGSAVGVAFVGVGALVGSVAIFNKIKKDRGTFKVIVIMGAIGAAIAIFKGGIDAIDAINGIKALFDMVFNIHENLTSGVLEKIPVNALSQNLSPLTASTNSLARAFSQFEEFNNMIDDLNVSLLDLNELLSSFGLESRFDPLGKIFIDEFEKAINVDPNYVTLSIASSELGGVNLEKSYDENGVASFSLSAEESQMVTINFKYFNEHTGLFQKKITYNLLASNPKAHFSYSSDDKYVYFDASDLEDIDRIYSYYHWKINGESVTVENNKYFEYNFPDYGTYTVSLTVEDENGVTDSYEEEVVLVGSEVGEVAICNAGYNESVMDFEVLDYDFSLEHFKDYENAGVDVCECKIIEVPLRQSVPIRIGGRLTDDGLENPSLEERLTSFTIWVDQTRVHYSVGYRFSEDNEVIWTVKSGGGRCNELVYK